MPSPDLATSPQPPQRPQRVVVVATPGPALSAFAARLAAALDLPLVEASDLSSPEDAVRLASFDGWVTTIDDPTTREHLLPRTDLLLTAQFETTGALRGFVRRTVRRMRSESAAEPDLGWIDLAPVEHPDLAVTRLVGPDEVAAWIDEVERSVSD